MAIKIFIDQGHNPVNPNAGAEGNGLREQDITYSVGVILADLLRQNGNFEVRTSRATPTTQLGTSNSSSLAARVNAQIAGARTISSACTQTHRRTHPRLEPKPTPSRSPHRASRSART